MVHERSLRKMVGRVRERLWVELEEGVELHSRKVVGRA